MIELNIATLIIGLLIQLILAVAAILYIKQLMQHNFERTSNHVHNTMNELHSGIDRSKGILREEIRNVFTEWRDRQEKDIEEYYNTLKEHTEAVLAPAEKVAAITGNLDIFSKRLGVVENMSKQFETDIVNVRQSRVTLNDEVVVKMNKRMDQYEADHVQAETFVAEIQRIGGVLEAHGKHIGTLTNGKADVSIERTMAALQFTIKELLKMLALSEELSRTVNYINNTPNLTAVDKANYEQRAQELVNQITESRKDLYKTE